MYIKPNVAAIFDALTNGMNGRFMKGQDRLSRNKVTIQDVKKYTFVKEKHLILSWSEICAYVCEYVCVCEMRMCEFTSGMRV